MIGAIYNRRQFFVQDHAGMSSISDQIAGIAQGCPLSPLRFIIVQTVMFYDIHARITLRTEPAFVLARDLLYADDTVLMSSSQENLQLLVNEVSAKGAAYGLEIYWEQTFQMSMCTGAIFF